MWFFILLIVLLAVTGLLGTVLKVTAVLFLSAVLTITLLIVVGWWLVKRQMRQYATGERGAPGHPRQPPGPRPGSGTVVDTEGHIKRDELPE